MEISEGHSPSCFIHFKKKSGELCKFIPHTISKVKEYCMQWLKLDGETNETAQRIANIVYDWPDHIHEILPQEIVNLRYHKECYVRFCDKSKVARAEKRKTNTPVQKNSVVTLVPDEKSQVEIRPNESIRSSACIASIVESGVNAKRRSIHVMPEQCIICKRKDAYIMDKVCLGNIVI